MLNDDDSSSTGYRFQGFSQFENVAALKPLTFSIILFMGYELPPRKCRNSSGRVQRKVMLLLYTDLLHVPNILYGVYK